MSNTSTARMFLSLNATFSAATGAALVLMPGTLSQIIFLAPDGWEPALLISFGISLFIFALGLVWMATNHHVTKRAIMIIIIADLGWILASALLIIFASHLFTENGGLIVEIVAGFVTLFAIGQFIGARQITPSLSQVNIRSSNGRLTASVTRTVKAPTSTVWKIMTDHPGYANVASNLSKVEVLSGDGLGMKRRCFGPKGESWEEICDLFEEGRIFGFRIQTDAPDYPYPISDLKGRWTVEPSGMGSVFSISITAKPKGGFITRSLFSLIAKRQFKTVLIDLADAWAKLMEQKP